MTLRIIDPHLHFFALEEGDYHWLVGKNPPPWPHLDKIKRTHTLQSLLASCTLEVAGLVHIEAGFDNQTPVRELEWLARNVAPFPYRAIAYAKIDDDPDQFKQAIAALRTPTCIGIRDITEGQDAERLSHPNTVLNLQFLASQNLHFEAQGHFATSYYRDQLLALCRAIPELTIIVTHFALAQSQDSLKSTLSELASAPNVSIKYSGQEMLSAPVAMHDAFEALLHHFGQERIMLASNHPVCLQKISYQALWESYQAHWPEAASFEHVSYLNAKRIYRFE